MIHFHLSELHTHICYDDTIIVDYKSYRGLHRILIFRHPHIRSMMDLFRPLLRKVLLGSLLHYPKGTIILPGFYKGLVPLSKCVVPARSLATVPAPRAEPPVKLCSIRRLEANRRLMETTSGSSGHLDKCVQFILNKDIVVQETALMLDKKVRIKTLRGKTLNTIADSDNIPSEMKIGKFNPKDDECIKKNLKSLLKSVNLSAEEDETVQEIFSLSLEDDHLQKINVIGLWLSQGVEGVRLPCDVAHRARLLYLAARKEEFTAEEAKIILTFMETEGASTRHPWAALSTQLGRTRQSIKKYYEFILQHKKKKKSGKFTSVEDKMIMKSVFELDDNALENVLGNTHEVWVKLGEQLDRRPNNVYNHWKGYIQPHLTRYNAGVHEDDIRDKLVDYCVKNGIRFRQDADWESVCR